MSLLRELVKIYKANPYRKANGQFASESNADSILKPKEHHSEAVKNTFKNARSKKAKQLLESRATNRKPKSDMYRKGYDNAAIGFAYIPDFNGKEDANEFSRGYKDGKKAITKAQKSELAMQVVSYYKGKTNE